jgi:uncharacterized surface protein with fasciclin (FAS1) repeats
MNGLFDRLKVLNIYLNEHSRMNDVTIRIQEMRKCYWTLITDHHNNLKYLINRILFNLLIAFYSDNGLLIYLVEQFGCNLLIESQLKKHIMNIVETAVNHGSFKTLVAAVTAAELVETLSGKGPFTVFAPLDEAFAALPAGTVESLVEPANKAKLQGILTYHVVPGKVMSTDLTDGMKAKTVNGAEITIHLKDGKVLINNAEVVAADVETDNGVIHVINKVIMPA